MKKLTGLLLALVLMLAAFSALAADDGKTVILPSKLTKIDSEAFANDSSITRVMIPKTIQSIGAKAFYNCKNLKEIYIGKSKKLKIGKNAFKGCEKATFYVYAGTPAEFYVLSKGFKCTLLEPDSDALKQAMKLVADNGGSSFLQSGTYATKRLIVRRKENRLPDISAYKPSSILQRDDNVYILQFKNIKNTEDCYTALVNDSNTIFVEPDQWVDPLDTDQGKGLVDAAVWHTDDPMGFAAYADFVKKNGKGSTTIAVVDSGISKQASYQSILRADGINILEAIDGESWTADSARHGSIIASVIKDCVGNANVKILPVRVVGADGKADCMLIAEGIDYAVDKGAKIINLSMNFPKSAIVEHSIKRASKKGVTVVVAAGNSGRNISGVFPANMSSVVTVSGIGPDFKLYRSNFGNGVDFCAPARYIMTTAFSGSQEGTSFAAPMIASAYALVSLDPNHTIADLKANCKMGAADGSLALSSAYGNGMPLMDRLAKIDPKSITLGSVPGTLKAGNKTQITWTIEPANATNKNVTVTSNNTGVITITKEGENVYANAVGPGTATIVATITGTSISAQAQISVVQPVTSIQIAGAQSTLIIGNTMQLTASIQPENASDKRVRWVSTNNAVATVSDTGLVTPVAAGTVGIYAAALDGYGAKSNTVTIQVIAIPPAESIQLLINGSLVNDQTITLAPGGTAQLVAKVLPEKAKQEVTYDAYPSGIVTVSANGLITAAQSGTTVITATASTGNNVRARLTVNVVVLPTSVTIAPPAKTTLDINETLQLTAVVSPGNATDKSVTWTSSNTAVATVDAAGLVKAVASGSANIIVTTNSAKKTASITITVRQPYTLYFNANGGTCSTASKTAYSGYEVGTLPTPTRDYYSFLGWFTAASGGSQVTSTTKLTATGSYTVYAQWQLKPEKGWVLESEVPAGAQITQTSWSYRESTESSESSLSGWIGNGNYWKETGSGSQDYASFPSTFNTSNTYYQQMHNKQVSAYENETNMRTVVDNKNTGFIYWHWMYNVVYANTTKRTISDRKGTWNPSGGSTGSQAYAYSYFYAIKSTKDCPYLDKYYCCSLNQASYNGASIVPANAASLPSTSGLGTPRFFRFQYHTSVYTDYMKMYRYYRDLQYQPSVPSGDHISNIVKYVKYREK